MSMALSLDKLEKDLAGKDGELLSLAKKTKLSLEKNQLNGVEAKVAVCLDISYSMSNLYSSGAISQLVKKLIPLGISFDDDASKINYLSSTQLDQYVRNYSERRMNQIGFMAKIELAEALIAKSLATTNHLNNKAMTSSHQGAY